MRFIFLLFFVISLNAFEARVVKILDGDTIVALTNESKQIKIRLFGIDAPEKKQDYGKKSRHFLSRLITGKIVQVEPKGKDRHSRLLGIIYHSGRDINALMVANGYAWAYAKFSKKYTEQEKMARQNKKGLWQGKDPTPPSDFRKARLKQGRDKVF